jgi:hypothetical protein
MLISARKLIFEIYLFYDRAVPVPRIRDISIGPPPPVPERVSDALQRPRDVGLFNRLADDPDDVVARFAWLIPGEPWLVTGPLAIRRGAIELAAVQLIPLPDASDARVTSDLLRKVQVGEIVAQAQAILAAQAEVMAILAQWTRHDEDGAEGTRQSIRRLTGSKRTTQGRPRIPDAILALVAEAYLAEIDCPGRIHDLLVVRLAGHPEVKAHLKDDQLTTHKIRHWIRLAGERGYLGPGQKGTRRRTAGYQLLQRRVD